MTEDKRTVIASTVNLRDLLIGLPDIPSIAANSPEMQGYGSRVFVTEDGEHVLKIPKVGEEGGKPIEKVMMGLLLAGIDLQQSWLVVDGNVYICNIEVPNSPDDLQNWQLAADAQLVVLLLQKLPGEIEVNHILSVVETSALRNLYFEAGKDTRKIHDKPVASNVDVDSWRRYSARHVVEGDERFDSIALFLASKPWINSDELQSIRGKMVSVAAVQESTKVMMRRIHGDNWEGNWRLHHNLELDGLDQIHIFDPALAYGSTGYDVGFAIGKMLIRYLTTNEEAARTNIETFFEGYGEGEMLIEALAEIWNPLTYKMLVGAAFDGYDENTCRKLVSFADLLVSYKLDNPEAIFSLDKAKELWTTLN